MKHRLLEASSSSTPGTATWMLTFGDLLTLLLCFFVALLSFTTFQEPNSHISAGEVGEYPAENTQLFTGGFSGATGGHNFALELYDEKSPSLSFKGTEFQGSQESLTVHARSRLIEFLASLESKEVSEIVIEACGGGSLAWHESMTRVLELQNTLLRMVPEYTRILRALGPACASVAAASQGESQPVARITVREAIQHNG